MLSKSVTYLLLLLVSSSCLAQDNTTPNAQPRVAPHLQECYRNRALFERNNRLPMTPDLLIELIRRVEDSNGFTLNIQQFASSLLHRFKQDGIVRKYSIDHRKLSIQIRRGSIGKQFSISAAKNVSIKKQNFF